ncbi:PhoD-like phosphatase-domain-containing protein [Aspergillus pseudodeflectus]|uniref:PhoD-like phosphatase-domain-containing protein n=1 Tax=Aspergillus pseudodeflectus TaxID=176178 RepID=A0ABR4J9M8_9EURO
MVYASTLLSLLALSSGALASYNGNLNYRSPSLNGDHINMGIDTAAIHRRSLAKRDETPYSASQLNFTHSVASGDPYANSVILWTRIAPSLEASDSNVTVSGDVPLYDHENERYAKASAHPICVEYRVFRDREGRRVVDSGRAYTSSDIDFTVKVEAKKLRPFTSYWYQFNVCGSDVKSPLGRTKTSPAKRDKVEEVKLAVHSCSNYPNGYFNAYGNVARKDNVDFVVHLGDYIYEYEKGIPGVDERAVVPQREIFSLYDYRTRLGQYRTDLDLVASHQNFPWITVWDDHEIANNGYRDGYSGLRNTEDSFLNYGPQISVDQRKMNAVRAYFEWMPIRQVDMDDGLRIWRNFQMGDLLDLIMIDTRNYDRSITDISDNSHYIELIHDDAGRSIMGARQENWFYRQLAESNERGAKWRVIGNQLVFAHIQQQNEDGTLSFSTDSWTAYRANQNRTLKHMYENDIRNNINIAGDSHVNWVSDMIWEGTKDYNAQTGAGAVGVEFAGTAVSSGGFSGDSLAAAEETANTYSVNPELKWVEGFYRGYFELHLRQDEAEARYFGCPTVATRNSWELPLANWTVKHSESHLQRPLAGGEVEAGYLQVGELRHSNVSLNTETGEWKVVGFDQMFIQH